MPMVLYLLRRTATMLATLLAISALVFFIIKLPPGDFLSNQIAELQSQGDASAAAKAEWGELSGEAFVDFHPDWGARRLTDRAFAATGVQRRVALEVNDVHSLIDLVHHGLGVAVVPQPIARKDHAAGLAALPLAGAEDHLWEVSAALPEEDRVSPAARKLLSYLP